MPFDMESQISYEEKHHLPATPPQLTMASTNSTLAPPTRVSRRPPPRADHVEKNSSKNSELVRDIILGAADGLTVPFALTAGLSSLGSNKLVMLGGLAELFSGAISMGLGGYLACLTERDRYAAERVREYQEIRDTPDDEMREIYEIMDEYKIGDHITDQIMDHFEANHDKWFMMDLELRLEKPKASRAWISAGALGGSYFVGGLIPMIPYFIMHNVDHALFVSIGITVVVLLIFGFIKNYYIVCTKRAGAWGAIQTLLIGCLAAGTSYGIVRGLNMKERVITHVSGSTT